MTRSRYKDKLYDGRWKLVKSTNNSYVLENIYNQNQIVVGHDVMARLYEGKTTVSNVITNRLYKSGIKNVPFPLQPKWSKKVVYVISNHKRLRG